MKSWKSSRVKRGERREGERIPPRPRIATIKSSNWEWRGGVRNGVFLFVDIVSTISPHSFSYDTLSKKGRP